MVLEIAENDNARLGSFWVALLIGFDDKNAHAGDGFWDDILTAKGEIVLLADAGVDLVSFEALLFFVVGGQPNETIRVRWV